MRSYRAAVITGGLAVGCLAFTPAVEPIISVLGWGDQRTIEYAIIALAIILLLMSILFGGIGLVSTGVRLLYQRLRQEIRYMLRRSHARDLEYVDQISTRFFGDAASNLDQIRRVYSFDRNQIWILEKTASNGRGHRITTREGYIIVYRLNSVGEAAIRRGEFDGACPAREHLCRSNEKCVAAYIGAVVARFRARPYVLGTIENQFKLAGQYRSAHRVYARAATADGLRILQAHDFEPLEPNDDGIGGVFVLDRDLVNPAL